MRQVWIRVGVQPECTVRAAETFSFLMVTPMKKLFVMTALLTVVGCATGVPAAGVPVTAGKGVDKHPCAHGYELHGAAPWRPSCVFSEGGRTIIEFSDSLQATEVPSLLAVGGSRSDKVVEYSYDPLQRRMTVGTVIEHATLIDDVGRRVEVAALR